MTAQQLIINKYGKPSKEYFSQYCSVWEIELEHAWFPNKRIYINHDFKNALHIAFENLFDAGLHTQIKTFDGCYVERKVRGSSKISLHSWAMAMDLNAHLEKLGQTETHFTPEFIKIMTDADIFWGGNFKNRKDPMHFALFNG